jgi:1-deoxy-D-xylulose-5-phosphate synthase
MAGLLETVRSPADVRRLGVHQLPALAREVRELILRVVGEHPGHLASNLGVVDLTIALHYVYDFLHDRLIWDVGHQAYTHKILTGRRGPFERLREAGGASGFADKRESAYDPFTFGHTGTSISAGLGLVCGDKLGGRQRQVVAVIGDGAIASGMPFEALNQGGVLGENLLVVLNDNRMSISKSVGGISRYLSRIRRSRPYTELRQEAEALLSHIPLIGRRMEELLDHVGEGLQTALTPGGLFVELGWDYYGPVNGHDMFELVEALRSLKQRKGAVLLHVVTEKGHGCPPASDDPTAYHSSKPYEYRNGTLAAKPRAGGRPSFTNVFSRAVCELGERDGRLVVLTAAMPDGTGTFAFGEQFPDRFWDVGICEQHALGMACGLAASGSRPVVAIYSTFLQRAVDQLFHEVALQGAPIVLCLDRAGLVGPDGVSHHGLYDIAYTRFLPGFVLMAPRDGTELRMMLRWACATHAICVMRYPKESVPDEPADGENRPALEMGRAEVLREGEGAALLAYGVTANYALAAADLLAAHDGMNVTVVNARFAKPIDEACLKGLLESHDIVVTLEDHALAGGFGSAVAEAAVDAGLDASRLRRLGVPDELIDHAPRAEQLAQVGLSPEAIAASVRRWLG